MAAVTRELLTQLLKREHRASTRNLVGLAHPGGHRLTLDPLTRTFVRVLCLHRGTGPPVGPHLRFLLARRRHQPHPAARREDQVMSALRADAADTLITRHPGIDSTTPNVARMYDYYLGGKDNFAADRRRRRGDPAGPHGSPGRGTASSSDGRYGTCREWASTSSSTSARACPREGTSTRSPALLPGARTVYVDNDPVVLSHGRALLMSDDHTWVIKQEPCARPTKSWTLSACWDCWTCRAPWRCCWWRSSISSPTTKIHTGSSSP